MGLISSSLGFLRALFSILHESPRADSESASLGAAVLAPIVVPGSPPVERTSQERVPIVGRFITESGHFKPGRVLPKAFEPKFDKDRNRSETSVFRVSEIPSADVWVIGDREVGTPRGKPILARADIAAKDVSIEALVLEDDQPPPKHAVIVGWPEGPDEKDHRKSIQQELAARAILVVKVQ
jgi:hypothetical protein